MLSFIFADFGYLLSQNGQMVRKAFCLDNRMEVRLNFYHKQLGILILLPHLLSY